MHRRIGTEKFHLCISNVGFKSLAKQLEMTQPGVGYAVSRGEKIAKENKYQLL